MPQELGARQTRSARIRCRFRVQRRDSGAPASDRTSGTGPACRGRPFVANRLADRALPCSKSEEKLAARVDMSRLFHATDAKQRVDG